MPRQKDCLKSNKDEDAKQVKWKDDETFQVLNIWSDPKVQALLKSTRRHKLIYETIAEELNEYGYPRTWKQVRTKIANLRAEYVKVKPKSGSEPPSWKFWDKVHRIEGQKECRSDDNLIDSIDQEVSEYSNEEDLSESEKPPDGEGAKQSKGSKVLRKFSRAPRHQSENKKQEAIMLKEMVESNRRMEERAEESVQREIRAEERDQKVCDALVGFMNVFGKYLAQKMDKTSEKSSLGLNNDRVIMDGVKSEHDQSANIEKGKHEQNFLSIFADNLRFANSLKI